MNSALRSPAAWACLLVPMVVGLALDLWTKYEAFARLVVPGEYQDRYGRKGVESINYEFIQGFLHFRAHVNYGAVFGIGQGQWLLFLTVSTFALGLLGYLFSKSDGQRLYQLLLGTLFGGVLGNLYDRMLHGYVRDMIYIFPRWDIFPWIFNIADTMLCIGVGGMLVYSLFKRDEVSGHPLAEPATSADAATRSTS